MPPLSARQNAPKNPGGPWYRIRMVWLVPASCTTLVGAMVRPGLVDNTSLLLRHLDSIVTRDSSKIYFYQRLDSITIDYYQHVDSTNLDYYQHLDSTNIDYYQHSTYIVLPYTTISI